MVRINLGFHYKSNVVWFRGLIEALVERGEKPLGFFGNRDERAKRRAALSEFITSDEDF